MKFKFMLHAPKPTCIAKIAPEASVNIKGCHFGLKNGLGVKYAFTLAEIFHPMRKCWQYAFTLAEVFHPMRKCWQYAFTLAEVLITLGIIGVIAALTITGLITNINDKVFENQRKAAISKLTQAINMTYALGKFDSVSDVDTLIENLQTQLKIIQIYNKNNVNECFADSIKRLKPLSDRVYPTEELEKFNNYITVDENLLLSPYYNTMMSTNDLRGIITADGTAMLIGYIPNCRNYMTIYTESPYTTKATKAANQNPGTISINHPIANRTGDSWVLPKFYGERGYVLSLVDINGKKKPNILGKDVFLYQAQDTKGR